MQTAIVSIKELGTNCWSAHRFCGGRCARVMSCGYPEKRHCKAVQTEIYYLQDRKRKQGEIIDAKLRQLQGGDDVQLPEKICQDGSIAI